MVHLGTARQEQKVRSGASRIDVGYFRQGRGSGTCETERKRVYSRSDLGTETVEGSARPFQGIDDIESSDGLALGMLSVGNRVTDDLKRQGRKL